eukprot:5226544-Amphidinium_carterae.1
MPRHGIGNRWREEAKIKYPNASLSRVFTILGIKGSEGGEQVYKARSVLQGNQMVDRDGDP